MRYLILLLFMLPVHAAVVVCTDVTCTSETTKLKASLVAADRVLWCESGGALTQGAPLASCPNIVRLRVDNLQSYSWTLTDTGWYRYADIPATSVVPPPAAFPGYTCFPKDASEVRIAKRGANGFALWYCDKPTKIVQHWFCGDPTNIPDGEITFTKLIALAKVKRPCNATEKSLANEVTWLRAAVVNGTSLTAPAYKANANGTRNTTSVKRVPVGTECNWEYRLVDSYGKGTSFYAVVGEMQLYANCQLNGPISK